MNKLSEKLIDVATCIALAVLVLVALCAAVVIVFGTLKLTGAIT